MHPTPCFVVEFLKELMYNLKLEVQLPTTFS